VGVPRLLAACHGGLAVVGDATSVLQRAASTLWTRLRSQVNYGGEVPQKYYAKGKDGSDIAAAGFDGGGTEGGSDRMLVASVDRGSYFQLSHHIVIAGCSLR